MEANAEIKAKHQAELENLAEEKNGVVGVRRLMDTTLRFTQSTNLGSPGLIETEPATKEPSWG